MKKSLFSLILLLYVTGLFSACAGSQVKWYKPGATKRAFNADMAACENELLAVGDSQMGTRSTIYSTEACMEQKGWQALPAEPS